MKSNEGEKLEAKLPKGLNTQKKLLLLLFLPKNFVAVFYFFTFLLFYFFLTFLSEKQKMMRDWLMRKLEK
jgi:hypothetical protein